MSKGTLIAVVVVIAVVAVGYWAYQSQESPDEVVEEIQTELTEKSAEIINGEILMIAMETNPTTGYQWEVSYDIAYLDFTKRVYIPAGGILEDKESDGEEPGTEEDDEPIVHEDTIDPIEPPQGTETIIVETPDATNTDETLVGKGGEEQFYFSAKQTGETSIAFSYLRPWETDIDPIKKVVYTVTITEPSEEIDEEPDQEEPTE